MMDEAMEAAARAVWRRSIYPGYNDETKESEWRRNKIFFHGNAHAAVTAYLSNLTDADIERVALAVDVAMRAKADQFEYYEIVARAAIKAITPEAGE